jgi:hypothetical protein
VLKQFTDVLLGPGEQGGGSGPTCFAVSRDSTLLLLANPKLSVPPEITVYDLKTKKLAHRIRFRVEEQPIRQALFCQDHSIVYVVKSIYGTPILRRVGLDGRVFFETDAAHLPQSVVKDLQRDVEQYSRVVPHSGELNTMGWRFLSMDDDGAIYVAIAASALKYANDGKSVGVVPGAGYWNGHGFYRLDQVDKFVLGGRLSVFDEAGKQNTVIDLPKDRQTAVEFLMRKDYYDGFPNPLLGVDPEGCIYAFRRVSFGGRRTKGYESTGDVYVLKFTRDGTLSKKLLLPDSAYGLFYRDRDVFLGADGTLYYWKFFPDRMELHSTKL